MSDEVLVLARSRQGRTLGREKLMTRCRSGNEAIHLRASHACVGGNAPPLPRRFVAVSALLLMLSCAPLAARAESDSSNVEVGDSSTAVDDAALGNVIEATASGNSSAQCAGDQPPFADAGDSYSGYTNTTITFDGSDSYDNDGDVLGWRWRFGDGTMYPPVRSDGHVYWSSSPIVTHKYTQPGTYTLELWVIDDCLGISPIATAEVTITNPEPCGGCPEGLYCDEASGSCVQCLSDAHCDNGLFCDGQETCNEYGQCESGDEPCDGYDYCVEESDSCANCLSDDDCDNGLFCDGQETCNSGACIDGTAPCTADQECDEDADECVTLAECQTDDDCNDDIFCNGPELCIDGECQAGTPPCNAGQTCNEETQSCDNIDDSLIYYSPYNPPRRTSVAFSVTDSGLRDGNAFYYWMFSDGKYKYGQTCSRSFDADGSYSVTLTVYDSTTWLVLDSEEKSICVGSDCESAPECLADSDCDNGEYCDGQERCQNGQCVNGAAPCAEDELCDEDTDSCYPAPECETDADCANGNFCAGERTCVNGECQDGDSPCAYDEICDENSDSCVECLTHDDCSGDLLCSDSKTCVECLGDEDCPTGEACDLDANTCGVPNAGQAQADLTVAASIADPWPNETVAFSATGSATEMPNAFYYWEFYTENEAGQYVPDGVYTYAVSPTRSYEESGNHLAVLTLYNSTDWSVVSQAECPISVRKSTLANVGNLDGSFGVQRRLAVSNGIAWIIGSGRSLMSVQLPASSSDQPSLIAKVRTDIDFGIYGELFDIAANDEIIAVASDYGGVYILDANNPEFVHDSSVPNPLIARYAPYQENGFEIRRITIQTDYIYITGANNDGRWSVKILHIPSLLEQPLVPADGVPESAVVVGETDPATAPFGALTNTLLASGNWLFVGDNALGAVRILDISDPASPRLLPGSIQVGRRPVDISVTDDLIAVVDDDGSASSNEAAVHIFELNRDNESNPATLRSSIQAPLVKYTNAMFYQGFLYITEYEALYKVDITDWASPVIRGRASAGGLICGLMPGEGYLHAAVNGPALSVFVP